SRGEPVAEPLDGHDQARCRAVSLDRFSQPRDMDVDRARADVVGEAPHVTLQLLPGDELPAMLEQIDEQLKLARRQLHGNIVSKGFAAPEVDADVVDLDHVGARPWRGAPKHRVDAGQQLETVEGLADVVIRADSQAVYFVGRRRAGG